MLWPWPCECTNTHTHARAHVLVGYPPSVHVSVFSEAGQSETQHGNNTTASVCFPLLLPAEGRNKLTVAGPNAPSPAYFAVPNRLPRRVRGTTEYHVLILVLLPSMPQSHGITERQVCAQCSSCVRVHSTDMPERREVRDPSSAVGGVSYTHLGDGFE